MMLECNYPPLPSITYKQNFSLFSPFLTRRRSRHATPICFAFASAACWLLPSRARAVVRYRGYSLAVSREVMSACCYSLASAYQSRTSLSLLVAIFSGQQWLAGGQHQATHVDYVLVCSDNTLLIMKSWLYFFM
jgi:hypothetical protein